jgi:hypothetical protein
VPSAPSAGPRLEILEDRQAPGDLFGAAWMLGQMPTLDRSAESVRVVPEPIYEPPSATRTEDAVPSLTIYPGRLINRLVNTVTLDSSLSGKTVSGGIVNAGAALTTPPKVTSETPAPNATNVATNTTVKAVFSESIQSSTISFVLKDSNGNVVPAAVSYDDPSQTATLTPNAALANSTTYTATVTGAKDQLGNLLAAPVTWSFTTAGTSTGPFSIWSPSATPTNVADPDSNAVEVGVKFRSDVAGQITGIRFYKGATYTGAHVANLWSSSGQQLVTANFTNETAAGWQ